MLYSLGWRSIDAHALRRKSSLAVNGVAYIKMRVLISKSPFALSGAHTLLICRISICVIQNKEINQLQLFLKMHVIPLSLSLLRIIFIYNQTLHSHIFR